MDPVVLSKPGKVRISSLTFPGLLRTTGSIQQLQKPGQRLTAVADAVLLSGLELRRRQPALWQQEQRVVAEAVSAARGAGDLASPDAFGDERARVVGMPQQDHHAAIISFAVLLHIRENFFIVAGVPLLPAALAPGVAGRVHSGLAGESLDAQSRVIAKRRQACSPARVPRLGERILEKSGVRLIGLADAELRLRYELDRQRREQRPDLPQFSGIVAG